MTHRTNWMLYGAAASPGFLAGRDVARRISEGGKPSSIRRMRPPRRGARIYPRKPATQQAGVSPPRWKPGRAIALLQ